MKKYIFVKQRISFFTTLFSLISSASRLLSGCLYAFVALSLVFSFPCSAQVLINEVSSANDTVIADEDGDYEDWIELYNPTASAISLNKYSFLYEETNKKAIVWTFPNIIIKPKSHLLVFTSEKNRIPLVDHWEVPVIATDAWKYFVGVSEPSPNWRNTTYNDAAWANAPGGIGYGDGDDNTVVPPCSSLYMRKTFNLPDTGKISIGAFLADIDDACVAYLNNVEIARFNVGVSGDHPPFNASAYDEHEAQMYQDGNFSVGFFVPENLMDSALRQGANVFCIQTHNYSGGMDDLTSIPFFITGIKDTSKTYVSFPADFHPHTNFSLSNTNGFRITLKDSSGNMLDSQIFGTQNMQVNNSRGRNPDGGNNWCLFYFPTPNDTNAVSPCFSTYVQEPVLSLPGGFYPGVQTLDITVPAGTTVRYTRNGNIPSWNDLVYTGPISVTSTQVIRARAFSNTGLDLPSKTITNTYFINENISLPVISLCTDSLNLWDDTTGIYAMGPYAQPVSPYHGANFWNDWERQGHTEYFDKNDKQGFELDCALKIHGNASRCLPQKSFRIIANDDYQLPWINYRLFPDKNIDKFKNFNIRNAGIDWNTCHLRDRLMHKMAQSTTIDIMEGESVVLFLNGQYWGVYEIREKQDEDYLASNHNIDPDSVDLLRFEGDIMEGSNKDFFKMVNFIGNKDMTVPAHYDSALKWIDFENYCDYFISETYYNNVDWIWTNSAQKSQSSNNIKIWRTNFPPGKWRYVLWDTDVGLGFPVLSGTAISCPFSLLNTTIDSSITKPSVHAFMLRSLLKNNSFRNYFINRYCDLMNTSLYPDNFETIIYKLRDEMLPDMLRHFTKWGQAPIQLFPPLPFYLGLSKDVPSWLAQIDTMIEFIHCRPGYVRDSLQTKFSLMKQVDVTLDVFPLGAGIIKLNTLSKLDSLPWTGIYFDGVPVTMTAAANPGYKFSYWQSPSLIIDPNKSALVTMSVTKDEKFTAYFTKLDFDVNVYPNPFSTEVTFLYELPEKIQVSMKMFNLLGQEVAELISASALQNSGIYSLSIDARKYSLSDGVYLVKFTAGDFSKTIKIVKSQD